MLNVTTNDVIRSIGAAQQHHAAGRLAEAEALYRQVLAQSPQQFEAANSLAMLLLHAGRADEAVALLSRTAEARPNAFVMCHLGIALHIQGEIDKAIAAFERSLALGETPVAHYHLGAILITANRMAEANQHLQRAVALRGDFADAWRTLSVGLQVQGRLTDALVAGRRAMELSASADNHAVYAAAQAAAGRVEAALENFRKALTAEGASPAIHSAMLLVLHYLPAMAPPAMLAEHQGWNARHAAEASRVAAPHRMAAAGERPLRVGYVSADLRQHPVGMFLEPLLAYHDRARMETFCYDGAALADATTARLQGHAQHWRRITFMSDAQVAEMIRKDGIDILVDLAGHTSGNRLMVFARKPAPVQIAYLGYPDTTGMEAMDYRLTDGVADPPGITDHLYTEKLLRLPGGFLCYRAPAEAPLVEGMPSQAKGHVTLGSFNAFPKINRGVVAVWADILHKVPTARLLLKCAGLGDASPRRQVTEWFEDAGIPAGRLDLRGRVESYAEHLGLYNEVDIALDTFPYNGATTTCEALYMGAPVVTLAGQTHASRVGASIVSALNLSGLNLPELLTANEEQYVELTLRLCADVTRRGKMRSMLRGRLMGSALADGTGFARNVEEAYRAAFNEKLAANKNE